MRPAAGDTTAPRTERREADDGGADHGLAWTGGAGALRTGWKRIGVGIYASGDVRGGAPLQVDGRMAL